MSVLQATIVTALTKKNVFVLADLVNILSDLEVDRTADHEQIISRFDLFPAGSI